jgi:hypothetical protein
MSKYYPLQVYLENTNESSVVLTFQEIEEILGDSLPDSASTHNAWWANDTKHHIHAKAWLEAGWLVKSPSETIRAQKVTFAKNANEKGHEKTSERERTYEQQKSHAAPREIFAFFNCPFPPQDKNQLKRSYLEMIKQYHPDKVNGMGPEIKEVAEKKTKEINDMYEKALSFL